MSVTVLLSLHIYRPPFPFTIRGRATACWERTRSIWDDEGISSNINVRMNRRTGGRELGHKKDLNSLGLLNSTRNQEVFVYMCVHVWCTRGYVRRLQTKREEEAGNEVWSPRSRQECDLFPTEWQDRVAAAALVPILLHATTVYGDRELFRECYIGTTAIFLTPRAFPFQTKLRLTR
jgi:hypothetical protein